jgi:hypothetical protein
VEKPKGEKLDNPSPQWVRETLCEDVAIAQRNRGQVPDTRAIESQVAEDIRTWAAHEREAKRAPRKKAPKLDKKNPAESLARDLGYELIKKPVGSPVPKRKRCMCNHASCKSCKLWSRIRTLLQLRPGYQARQMDFMFPAYAREIVQASRDCERRQRKFAGLNATDANRALLRAMQDIADRSTAVLGNWWVK